MINSNLKWFRSLVHWVGFHDTFNCFDWFTSSSFLGLRRGVCSVRSLVLPFDGYKMIWFFSFWVFELAFVFGLLFDLLLDWVFLFFSSSMMIFLDLVKEGVILFSSLLDLQALIKKINSSAIMVNKLWIIPIK